MVTGRVRVVVRDVLNHLAHDDGIAYYETHAPRRSGAVTFAQDLAEVKRVNSIKVGRAHRSVNDLLQFEHKFLRR